ncbi:MAG: FGGY-family carbohydrate kinase [Actinomycetota bacterium]
MKPGFIGIDIATQSTRALLVDENADTLATASADLAQVIRGPDGAVTQDPQSWVLAVTSMLSEIQSKAKSLGVKPISLVISATSGTFTLVNESGAAVIPAAMYNDSRAANPVDRAIFIAASEKLSGRLHLVHTPEFVIAALLGKNPKDIATDWSHALKTGVDLDTKTYSPEILERAQSKNISLPTIVSPGTKLGAIGELNIYAGMTDGCTAQISAGGADVGSAVTTLGTTMVIKLVTDKNVTGPGFYSHLLPAKNWLVGGASNLGGISFKNFTANIKEWDHRADAHGPASFVTYPLDSKGERFPISNKELARFESAAAQSEVDQYRAILEGIAFAERLSYELLSKYGAPLTGELRTAGGGAKSPTWCKIRATVLNRAVIAQKNSGSDLGAALIAIAATTNPINISAGISAIKLPDGEIYLPVANEIEALSQSYKLFSDILLP